MKYRFRCLKCKTEKIVEMSIAEYSKYSAVCTTCKSPMDRVYEMPITSGTKKSSGTSSKTVAPMSHSSCGGSCSSCPGCGV